MESTMKARFRAVVLACCLLTWPPAGASRADDPDPEPPPNIKVLSQPEDKARDVDVIFVPTPQAAVDRMLELAKVTKKDVLFDLGCGDGRIVVTAAKKYKCQAVGFEIDPARVKDTKANIQKNKLHKQAHVRQRDVFKLDLSEATVVTLYLLPNLNAKLVPRLNKMKKGSRVVSHAFDIPGYKADKVESVKLADGREHDIYLYTTPLRRKK
jgi:hypothetical protein